MTTNAMKLWMQAATPEEQHELAAFAETSRSYLYHLSAGRETNYHREPKPEKAARIEAFTTELNKRSKGRTPVVYRTDLVAACRNCAFAHRCLGARALASEFPYVETLEEGSLP